MDAFRLTESAAYWLFSVSRTFRTKLQSKLIEHGLFPGQDLLLERLIDQDGQSQRHLADGLQVRQPTISRMVDRLAQRGYVSRKTDPNDGRLSRVFLTPSGREVFTEIKQIWSDLERETFSGLTTEERLLLRRLLMQL